MLKHTRKKVGKIRKDFCKNKSYCIFNMIAGRGGKIHNFFVYMLYIAIICRYYYLRNLNLNLFFTKCFIIDFEYFNFKGRHNGNWLRYFDLHTYSYELSLNI